MTRRTHEQFIEIVKSNYGDEYEVLTEYQTKRKKVKVRHKSCGNEFETIADNLIRLGRMRCKECYVVWNKRTHEQFKEQFDAIKKGEYVLLSEYISANETVSVEHVTCGHVWKQDAKNALLGYGCPKCGHVKAMEVQSLPDVEFERRIDEKYKGEYTLLSEYERMHKDVLLIHNNCGHVFKRLASEVLAGCRCPNCPDYTASKGEQRIAEHLTNGGCKFVSQYSFNDCRYQKVLPFDFAVFKGGRVQALIEYQGIQHYEPVEHFGGVAEHFKVVVRDQVKRAYCEVNNIPLIEIPYWIEDVEDMLTNSMRELETTM